MAWVYSSVAGMENLSSHQFGHQAGARSIMYLAPESRDGILILSNTYGTDLKSLAEGLWDITRKSTRDTLCLDPFLIS